MRFIIAGSYHEQKLQNNKPLRIYRCISYILTLWLIILKIIGQPSKQYCDEGEENTREDTEDDNFLSDYNYRELQHASVQRPPEVDHLTNYQVSISI